MTWLRRTLLCLLPKVVLSRTTGVLARLPLPHALRGPFLSAFARRYGADLGEMGGALREFRRLAAFFQRPRLAGAPPIWDAPPVAARGHS